MTARIVVVAACAAWVVGCGGGESGPEVGTLQIVIDGPPAPATGPRFLVLQGRDGTFPFDVAWEGEGESETPLVGGARTEARLTMESEDDTINVNLKALFCVAEGCTAVEDATPPAIWFAIEHPFFLGETTEWRATVELPSMPPMDTACSAACDDYNCGLVESECQVTYVDKCQVRGCVEGDPSISYCRADGTHFCEPEAAP